MERPVALDQVYYDDFCSLSGWAREHNVLEQKVDFTKLTWPDALKAIDSMAADTPPPPASTTLTVSG